MERHPIQTLIDQDLLPLDEIWAAAGTPHAVFALTPADLVNITSVTCVQATQMSAERVCWNGLVPPESHLRANK